MKDEWVNGAEALELVTGTVHVWCASLTQLASHVSDYEKTLSPDERIRADRFHFEKDRVSFVVARGILRELLGRYLKQEPARLRFSYAIGGKPSLVLDQETIPLCFNLSHSGEFAVYALTLDRELGVDIEAIRLGFPGEQIAEDLFSPCEKLMLKAIPDHRRREAFFTCWTCKEAYLKARGDGLSLPLNEFDVSSALEEGKTVIFDSSDGSRWWVRRLKPGEGYAAALSGEGRFCRVECYLFE